MATIGDLKGSGYVKLDQAIETRRIAPEVLVEAVGRGHQAVTMGIAAMAEDIRAGNAAFGDVQWQVPGEKFNSTSVSKLKGDELNVRHLNEAFVMQIDIRKAQPGGAGFTPVQPPIAAAVTEGAMDELKAQFGDGLKLVGILPGDPMILTAIISAEPLRQLPGFGDVPLLPARDLGALDPVK